MSAHLDHAATVGLSVPCSSWHQTFGGLCLNCGFDPLRNDPRGQQRLLQSSHSPRPDGAGDCATCGVKVFRQGDYYRHDVIAMRELNARAWSRAS